MVQTSERPRGLGASFVLATCFTAISESETIIHVLLADLSRFILITLRGEEAPWAKDLRSFWSPITNRVSEGEDLRLMRLWCLVLIVYQSNADAFRWNRYWTAVWLRAVCQTRRASWIFVGFVEVWRALVAFPIVSSYKNRFPFSVWKWGWNARKQKRLGVLERQLPWLLTIVSLVRRHSIVRLSGVQPFRFLSRKHKLKWES